MTSDPKDMSFEERLDATHEFPGPFTFKLIGANTPAFLDAVLEVGRSEAAGGEPRVVSRRESSGARHQSITLEVQVAGSAHVIRLYERFKALEGMRIML